MSICDNTCEKSVNAKYRIQVTYNIDIKLHTDVGTDKDTKEFVQAKQRADKILTLIQ